MWRVPADGDADRTAVPKGDPARPPNSAAIGCANPFRLLPGNPIVSRPHNPSAKMPHQMGAARVAWAVREAKDHEVPVCLFPGGARWTACGHRLLRSGAQPGTGRTVGGVVRAVTADPLCTSCHLCRIALRKTLFSGAPESQARASFNALFFGRAERAESSPLSPWRPPRIGKPKRRLLPR